MHSFKHGIVATILVFSTAPGITGPLERLFGTEEADQPAQASTVAISSVWASRSWRSRISEGRL